MPLQPGQRRALEVYPHSATVALFDLARVLPYKARRGRTLADPAGGARDLVDLLGGLAQPSLQLPPLSAPDGSSRPCGGRAVAPTAAALRRLEDPIDAIVCAYVAALFLAGRTCVIGDSETGRNRHADSRAASPVAGPAGLR